MVGVWVQVICRPEDGMSGRILQTTPSLATLDSPASGGVNWLPLAGLSRSDWGWSVGGQPVPDQASCEAGAALSADLSADSSVAGSAAGSFSGLASSNCSPRKVNSPRMPSPSESTTTR